MMSSIVSEIPPAELPSLGSVRRFQQFRVVLGLSKGSEGVLPSEAE